MTRTTLAVFAAVLLSKASGTAASMELVLPVSSFRIESNFPGVPGLVEVAGNYSEKGPSRLTVRAFGKTYSLDPQQLKRLDGFQVNGVALTYEGGSALVGGQQLYVELSRGLKRRTITFTERGDISISEPTGR